MDVRTAHGALNRWAKTDVPMVVIIGPSGHDAATDANPFLPKDNPLELAREVQQAWTVEFLDRYLKPEQRPARVRRLFYFTLGEDVWKETSAWPPKGSTMTPFYLRSNHVLAETPPRTREPSDAYLVDYTASTGFENGWWTKLGSADVYYGDRKTEDEKLLVYTSHPLLDDVEITDHPEVTLYLSSTETDGAIFVYLEDVAPDGRVTHITEGELRLLHRRLCSVPAPFDSCGPCHSYQRADAAPMPKGELQEVTLGLYPTSVLLRRGHSIRVAIAGHDASIFARIPAQGTPTWSIAHGSSTKSRIVLPIVGRRHGRKHHARL